MPRSTSHRSLLASIAAAAALVTALVGGAPALAQGLASHTTSPAAFVPYQFISKSYTESLGRAPTQKEWSAQARYFQKNGCSAATLAVQLNKVLGSSEFTHLGYTPAQEAEVAYRTVLNREPDPSGFANMVSQLSGGTSWSTVVAGAEQSPEFAALARTICTTKNYGFGTTAPISYASGPGYSGDEAGLQALLDATAAGGTVSLARGAVIPIVQTLTIPSGVTLTTTGRPARQAYAAMGRLSRQPGWEGESVGLTAGSTLTNVWVDGDRTREAKFAAQRFNIILHGGDSVISNDRIGNTAGATNMQLDGFEHGVPYCSAVVSGNLIDAYTSQHANQLWSDGISDGCENSTITKNEVIDASDVGIILFATFSDTLVQKSQVTDNTVIQAGNGAFALLGVDPSTGQPAGSTRLFGGSLVADNTIWTAPTAISTFGITVGTYAWFGVGSAIGTGSTVRGNTSGTLSVAAETAIDVSGILNTTVVKNKIRWLQSDDPRSACPQHQVGASVSSGYASGTIQPYTDALYSLCVGVG